MIFLFVPLYGAVLYQFRGKGYRAIFYGILWMLPGLFIPWRSHNTMTMMILGLTYLVTLSIAVWQNWFQVSRKLTLAGLWGATIGSISALGALILLGTGGYQSMRLQVLLSPGNTEGGYQLRILRQILSDSRLLGSSQNLENVIQMLPEQRDFLLAYVLVCFGLILTVLLSVLLISLFLWSLRLCFKQRNQLGLIMGSGCSCLFLIQVFVYIMGNAGFIFGGTYCPFFTYGNTGMLITYVLLGILLSIYRYKNVLPETLRRE